MAERYFGTARSFHLTRAGRFFLQTIHGCDSTVNIKVTGTTLGTYNITVDTAVCLGSTLPINGAKSSPPPAQETFYLASGAGCELPRCW